MNEKQTRAKYTLEFKQDAGRARCVGRSCDVGHAQDKPDEVILDVDTHLYAHVGAMISVTGKLLATLAVPTDMAGHLKLLMSARSFGHLRCAGLEGTGT